MKAQKAKRFGAITTLALTATLGLFLTGTACGANPIGQPGAITTDAAPAQSENPEMQAAEERLQKAQAQLDLSKRQLSAARSLLKAAEADLRAAKADRDAVAMRYQAQNLAEEAGMPTQAGRAVATTSPAPAQTPKSTSAPTQLADRSGVDTTASAAAATPQAIAPLPSEQAQSMDLNALPQQNESDPPPPVTLR